jgi:hypothetical protein
VAVTADRLTCVRAVSIVRVRVANQGWRAVTAKYKRE